MQVLPTEQYDAVLDEVSRCIELDPLPGGYLAAYMETLIKLSHPNEAATGIGDTTYRSPVDRVIPLQTGGGEPYGWYWPRHIDLDVFELAVNKMEYDAVGGDQDDITRMAGKPKHVWATDYRNCYMRSFVAHDEEVPGSWPATFARADY